MVCSYSIDCWHGAFDCIRFETHNVYSKQLTHIALVTVIPQWIIFASLKQVEDPERVVLRTVFLSVL